MTTHLQRARASLRIPTMPAQSEPSSRPLGAERRSTAADTVLVHLRNVGQYATLYRADYDRVVAEIGHGSWFLNSFMRNGTLRSYVRATSPTTKRLVMISRIIAQAPARTSVKHLDGDQLNLRLDNLHIDLSGGAGGCKKRRKRTGNVAANRASAKTTFATLAASKGDRHGV